MAEAHANLFANKYELLKKLGEGGFASVYLAKDITLGRQVAIKVLKAHLPANDPTFLQRFEREAQTVAQLNHPNIIGVYEFGQENGQYFMVMPYLTGPNLADLLRQQGSLDAERVLEIADQVGAALDYAHHRGVVHRDVKPPNVIFNEQGSAILTDFGIVKMMNETTALTQAGGVIGTPFYMAPEQWATDAINSRTDLYALGIMVYQMLTGQVPFPGPTPPRIMHGHLSVPPPPPQTLNSTLPAAVEPVLMKVLAKLPEQRYQSAAEFCADLRTALIGRTSESKDDGKQKATGLPKAVWMGAVALLVVLIGGGIFLFSGGESNSPAAVPAVQETRVEIDGQTVSQDFQQVVCGKSHRLEIKLLDTDRARIEPGLFAYNWRFEPDDPTNEDSLNSASYARIYQVPCELNNQTVIVEVQQEGKTLSTRSVNFNIAK